ncbi:UPF0287-domain-containing protein [Macrolepiota fuliginosa MF-IS2]|uniref:COX assembly mitochondrial protein n=1 Tax=Macrolepiota fuliginosa MF-IS2 TaxID=1400762 RepID=A0A9P6C210_9AGAR|nr:UPF0287-domain-containing protein [Macrolepiota fuliginosa MF-IS2]
MHPQLSDKRLVCRDFIKALEECHSSVWRKFTGGCNRQKDELNHCLRTERVARSAQNREIAKERKAKTEQALKDFRSQ